MPRRTRPGRRKQERAQFEADAAIKEGMDEPLECKYPQQSWWMDDLIVAPSAIHGEGVFATTAIVHGSVVIRWGGVVFTEDELKRGMVRQHTYVGIGSGLYLANPADMPPGLDDFMNHSCDGNLWMNDEITLVARRDIGAGEELTADYALWLNNPDYQMKTNCNCSSQFCRGTIRGLDWQLPNVQRRYAGHFSPFINTLIENYNRRSH
jgi:uncharacterized protein